MGHDLESFLKEWHSDSDYVVAHTSGSTGTPKLIQLLKSDMRASARATNTFFDIKAGDLIASPLSADYIAGKMMAVRAIEANARLVELPVSNTIILPDTSDVYKLLPIVPTQIDSLLNRREYAARITNLLIGGSAPSVSQCRRLVEAGYKAWISYGMTETCSHVALASADDPERIFYAMPGISFAVDRDDRLIINAPDFNFKILQTNDIVELITPRTFRYRGRADNIINSGGLKLVPEELEQMYAPYINRPFYVVGRKDEELGAKINLVVEGMPIDGLLAILRNTLPHRLCPKQIEFVAALQRTSNGKIIRK